MERLTRRFKTKHSSDLLKNNLIPNLIHTYTPYPYFRIADNCIKIPVWSLLFYTPIFTPAKKVQIFCTYTIDTLAKKNNKKILEDSVLSLFLG